MGLQSQVIPPLALPTREEIEARSNHEERQVCIVAPSVVQSPPQHYSDPQDNSAQRRAHSGKREPAAVTGRSPLTRQSSRQTLQPGLQPRQLDDALGDVVTPRNVLESNAEGEISLDATAWPSLTPNGVGDGKRDTGTNRRGRSKGWRRDA